MDSKTGFSLKFLSPDINLFKISASIKPSNYKEYHKEVLYNINKAICYNQGTFAQYSYLASIKHKAMKDELLGECNPNQLKIYCEDLENHLYTEMSKAFNNNFEFIKTYFKGRRKADVRVCVKLYEINPDTEEIEIIDFLRDLPVPVTTNTPITENTGFDKVYSTGRHFICNNIPEEVINNRYSNPRLDDKKASRYKLTSREKYKVYRKQHSDEKWIDCWHEREDTSGNRSRPLPEACYKSTMIIPMTLLGNELYPDFRARFKIDDEFERAIYGFLCLDHHTINYFEEEPDRFVGYMFADLMSLYQLTQLIYTDLSTTYESVIDLI